MDKFVSVNGTLRLTCNVSGSEPISYQWLKDGQQLQDDGRVSGSNASVLVVDPVEGDDFGGYQCNASNDVDQVQSDVAMVAGECVATSLLTINSGGQWWQGGCCYDVEAYNNETASSALVQFTFCSVLSSFMFSGS